MSNLIRTWRIIMHIPVGMFGAFCTLIQPGMGLIFTLLFLAYELNQDKHKRDRAYRDIIGACIGVAIFALLFLWKGFRYWLIFKILY